MRAFTFGTLALLLLALPASAETQAGWLETALPGLGQRTHKLDDWRGKLRIVNFWATWCQPCRHEIPEFNKTRQAWQKRGVEVIGVALDNADDVSAFARQTGITYPLLLAEEQGAALMQGAGNLSGALPFTLLLDAQGKVLQRHTGPIDARRLEQWLQEASGRKS